MRRNHVLEATIVEKYATVEPFLDGRGYRISAATESRAIGYGGGDVLVSDAQFEHINTVAMTSAVN